MELLNFEGVQACVRFMSAWVEGMKARLRCDNRSGAVRLFAGKTANLLTPGNRAHDRLPISVFNIVVEFGIVLVMENNLLTFS